MRKKIFFVAVIFIFILMLASCNKKEDEVNKNNEEETLSENNEENINVTDKIDVTDNKIEEENNIEEKDIDDNESIEESHEGMAINPLTGLYINEDAAKRRPFAVMISDIYEALPQSGIGQADVIYEALAEGGIPRLLALFQDFDAEKIGPVRSARHYYLDFSFDFDAIYVHYGKSPQALKAFSDLQAPNMDGLSALDTIMCFQDPNRNRPHSTYTSYDGLMAGLEYKGYRSELKDDLNSKFKFAENEYDLNTENIATNINLPFSHYYLSWFEYNEEEKLYERFQYYGEQIDIETNEQLKFKNIIVQNTDMWVIPGDPEGRLDMSLIDSGTGYYITNGKYIPITWEKTSHYEPTHYYMEDGQELLINPGKTWIVILPSYNASKITFE